MFEKNLQIAYLLDFYGEVLPEKTRRVMGLYYNEDLSLSEIAQGEGISRQGVRHLVKSGEESLLDLEKSLGLASHYSSLQTAADTVEEKMRDLSPETRRAEKDFLDAVLACVKQIRNS